LGIGLAGIVFSPAGFVLFALELVLQDGNQLIGTRQEKGIELTLPAQNVSLAK
jgi:hypothetical protein